LVELIKEKVQSGTPYIGWSAGSNLTGLSIRTTNDMPIVQLQSFEAFGFLPFQINPHYFNETRAGFHGETRDQRLEEFTKINPGISIVCLPEGTWLWAENGECKYEGGQPGIVMVNQNGQLVKKPLLPDELPVENN
jgi:dipeptidase E